MWRELLGLVQGAPGDRARVPSQRTVIRWLERWVEDGLMETDTRVAQGRGKDPIIYRLARALSPIGCHLSDDPPEFFQRKGSLSDTETECQINEVGEAPAPEAAAQDESLSDTPDFVSKTNLVPDRDLADHLTNDSHTDTTRAHAREDVGEGQHCWEEEDYPNDW